MTLSGFPGIELYSWRESSKEPNKWESESAVSGEYGRKFISNLELVSVCLTEDIMVKRYHDDTLDEGGESPLCCS